MTLEGKMYFIMIFEKINVLKKDSGQFGDVFPLGGKLEHVG